MFLYNGNWWKLFLKHRNLIRSSIVINVLKLLSCRTTFLGYHIFSCLNCGHSIRVPHSCKSRFCSSCGKKATDNWIKNRFNALPNTAWQHITFTIDARLKDLFWLNRHLFNKLPPLAANIIKHQAKQKGFLPGIFLALHTFGRDLKRNPHIHLSTTVGGLSLSHDSWISSAYFYHKTLKNMWKYAVITLLRNEFKKGNLILPNYLKHSRSYTAFCSWLSVSYNKTWVVHLALKSDNQKRNVDYLGKYLKRPPIGETRIKSFVNNIVTFEYLDHYTKTNNYMSLHALDFIARLIAHVPDKHFRSIRYYGFLANRVSSKLLPLVYKLLNTRQSYPLKKVFTSWRTLFKNSFGIDPLLCSFCNLPMRLTYPIVYNNHKFLTMHKEIANGHFPLL
ncbi:IS91 family transposase [Patescibacteria group bacterium]|nr:IS91 family transposase [Patescibacteria group bacterium]MBU1784929.1 IS91 family transposase [Candidatus Omnitrophota bacterium]